MGNRQLIAGNWKMNGLLGSLGELSAITEAAEAGLSRRCDFLICPPATLVQAAIAAARGAVPIGGQDCHAAESGAHTGDISAAMLADLGATHVIVGHSERRADHGEGDGAVRAKAEAARRAGLVAIICVGETEAERDEEQTIAVIGAQLAGSLPDGARAGDTVVAYEPVWAIGTGKTPTAGDVATVHRFIRNRLTERFGAEGSDIRILYGGSVKPRNAAELLAIDNVDGALVGGASLHAKDFIAICEACTSDRPA